MCFEVRDKRGWPVTPSSPNPAQVLCEALGKGLLDGDPGPLTHTHISQGPAIHVRTAACRPAALIVSVGTMGDNGVHHPLPPPFFSVSFQTSL